MRGSIFIDDARCDALCSALKRRVASLTEVVNDHKIFVSVSNCHDDVSEDIAYSGEQDDFER